MCHSMSCRCERNAIKGCTAEIVPNHSAFRTRNCFGNVTSALRLFEVARLLVAFQSRCRSWSYRRNRKRLTTASKNFEVKHRSESVTLRRADEVSQNECTSIVKTGHR